MQVKTFEALNIKDAVKAVKKEFGQNAVILSTKERVGGASDAKIVEVTAAMPETHRHGASSSNHSDARQMSNELTAHLNGLDVRLSTITEKLPTRANIECLQAGLQEMKMLLLENLRNKDGSPLKNLPGHLVDLDRSLRAAGIDEVYIAKLMKHLASIPESEMKSDGAKATPEEYFKSQAIRWMLKKIKIAPQWNLTEGSTATHVFMGGTGVGKTSLVAKLAAHYFLKKNKKILLVSFDPYRLAAAEQLRIYSKIIGVPFTTINSADELAKKALEARDKELILVDTAGYSTKNASCLAQLEQLRKLAIPLDMHLVVSVTEREDQMDRMIRFFSSIGIQSLSFTKLDDCWTLGPIFNMSQRWSLPLSFFSTGPEIPEDIERATRERVVERFFGI